MCIIQYADFLLKDDNKIRKLINAHTDLLILNASCTIQAFETCSNRSISKNIHPVVGPFVGVTVILFSLYESLLTTLLGRGAGGKVCYTQDNRAIQSCSFNDSLNS
jgi:hypothetical protein